MSKTYQIQDKLHIQERQKTTSEIQTYQILYKLQVQDKLTTNYLYKINTVTQVILPERNKQRKKYIKKEINKERSFLKKKVFKK